MHGIKIGNGSTSSVKGHTHSCIPGKVHIRLEHMGLFRVSLGISTDS